MCRWQAEEAWLDAEFVARPSQSIRRPPLSHVEYLALIKEDDDNLSAPENIRRGQRESLSFVTYQDICYLRSIILHARPAGSGEVLNRSLRADDLTA